MTASALLATFALPIASQAASTTNAPPQRYLFQTRMTESMHAGEYDGTLRSDGLSQWDRVGHVSTQRRRCPQRIGRNVGDTDLARHRRSPPFGAPRGTLKNGVLQATANIPGPDTYTFVGTVAPAAH